MVGIGEDAYTPIMYQDLANPFMGQMNMPMGGMGMMPGMAGGIPKTSYLGGTKMQSQASADEFINRRKEQNKKDWSLFKKALLVFGGCIALGCIKPLRNAIKADGGIKNFCTNQWNKLKTWAKNIF